MEMPRSSIYTEAVQPRVELVHGVLVASRSPRHGCAGGLKTSIHLQNIHCTTTTPSVKRRYSCIGIEYKHLVIRRPYPPIILIYQSIYTRRNFCPYPAALI
jgi:hypothetical protein